MFKNTNSKRMTGILLALVLVTSLFIGGSIARYVTSTSSEDNARVAVWGINADEVTMDIFNATYQLADGTIVAQSNNTTDKIIAPGTSKDNYFSIINTDPNLIPEVMYEIRIDLDDSEIDQRILDNPSIQWRLDEGIYGTWEETKAKILALSGHESGVKTYSPGELADEFKAGVTHTIGWTWIMDNNNNEMDTEMGNAAAESDLTAKINVKVTATQVNVDTTGMLEGNGSVYDINNPTPLIFRSAAPANELVSVKVGGETLTKDTDYTVDSGSTIITLTQSCVSRLGVGNHVISIISQNMTANASFKIKETISDFPGNSESGGSGSTGLVHNDIIPNGGKYYVGVDKVYDENYSYIGNIFKLGFYDGYDALYEAEDRFPAEINTGDVYVYGDYEYRYNQYFTSGYWETDNSQNGWGVRVLNTNQTSYGEILTTINKKNITDMSFTFFECTNLIESPIIPETVIDMNRAYVLSGITKTPIFPNSVTNLDYTFHACSKLTEVTNYPKNITELNGTFADCTSLKNVPEIPLTITGLGSTFNGCSSLEKAPIIHENITNLYTTFFNCIKLNSIEINTNKISLSNTNDYFSCLLGTNVTNITGNLSNEFKQAIADNSYLQLAN